MPIGGNMNLQDKLIKDTTIITRNKNNTSNKSKILKEIPTSKAPIKSNTNNTGKTLNTNNNNNTRITNKTSKTSKDTADTVKMTFYIQKDILNNLYNYAYWDRMSVTKAFNKVMQDGLKGKSTKQRKVE